MRQDNNQTTIQIQEPPIKELRQKSSCLRRGCLMGGSCLIAIIIGTLVIVGIIITSGSKTLKDVPENFPADVHLYDKENIQKITFISGGSKRRSLAIATFLPKLILSPFLKISPATKTVRRVDETGRVTVTKEITKEDFLRLFKTPVGETTDTVVIVWTNLGADKDFILDYYQTEFAKVKYASRPAQMVDAERTTIEFKSPDGRVTATLYVEDASRDRGTDYVSLTVDF